MTEVRLKIELRAPQLGQGRFRCGIVSCRTIMVNANHIGVLFVGTDEILLCPVCAQKLVAAAGPKDRPAETLLLDEEGRARRTRIYAGLHRVIGRRYGGFSLVEADDGCVQVIAANADLSIRIEQYLVAAGVEVERRNQLLLEVRSEDGLAELLRPSAVMALTRGSDANF